MAKIRTKIISFRISEHELESVEETTRKHGFESVSMFARAATLNSQMPEPNQSSFDLELNRLWRRLEGLTTTLEKLIARAGLVLK